MDTIIVLGRHALVSVFVEEALFWNVAIVASLHELTLIC